MSDQAAVQSHSACHVMAKPAGPICNLDCNYCFYLEKERLYPGEGKQWKMDDQTLELYISQQIAAQDTKEVHFAWQGGEPTLMGIGFYQRVVELQEKYAGEKKISNAFQTNGILLNDEWGKFLADNRFLVGISLDGPAEIHNRYRKDRAGHDSFNRVEKGMEVLKLHSVEFNILLTVNANNVRFPIEIYSFLKETGTSWFQFIPIVEREARLQEGNSLELIGPGYSGKARVSKWSVDPV
ncbi:MAG: radical SAM protein, partial [Proteobacteria bacterium]|nr:radical SAM protein [Pseudomonadota bacterium]